MSNQFTPERLEELRALAEQVKADPEIVNSLGEDDVRDLRIYANPFGTQLREGEFFANMSIINWSQVRMKKMLTTALIGYIFRMQMEYEPEEELETLRRKCEKDKEGQNAERCLELEAELARESAAITKTARKLIARFLARHFEFNPDKHLRGAATNPTGDPEREKAYQDADEGTRVRMQCEQIETKIKAKPESLYTFMRGNTLAVHQSALRAASLLARAKSTVESGLPLDDLRVLFTREKTQMEAIATELGRVAEPLERADTLAAWEHKPPSDVFHQFGRYFDNHYSEIDRVCTALYNDKTDIEFAIKLYSTHDTEDDARAYCDSHSREFTNDVLTVSSVGTTLLGPFKGNRDRVNYYNTNTLILREMEKQAELDHKLGKDLMEKEIKKKKKQNIAESGPDAASLASYAGVASGLSIGNRTLTREDREKLEREIAEAEDKEVPDDAIQMNKFVVTYGEDGDATLAREKFYTQAEAPLHLTDPKSQFKEKYQPKKIKSRAGEVAVIADGELKKVLAAKKPLEPAE